MALCRFNSPYFIPTFVLVQIRVFADINLGSSHSCSSNIPGQIKNASISNALSICLVCILQLIVHAFNFDTAMDRRTPGCTQQLHHSWNKSVKIHLSFCTVLFSFNAQHISYLFKYLTGFWITLCNAQKLQLVVIFMFLRVFWCICH